MKNKPLISLEGISKVFPGGLKALDDVSFTLNSGEIVGLLGENGAGKSTLMNILAGVYEPTQGDIIINGRKQRFTSPLAAQRLGVALVPQEPTLAPNMTAAENIFLGHEPRTKSFMVNSRLINEQSAAILRRIGSNLCPEKMVSDMSMAEKEAVGIAKAMRLEPRVLILDEVTAPLDQEGVGHLFKVIRVLKENGIGLVFISHRLREVLELTDKVVVLRDGREVGLMDTAATNRDEIIKLMVGQGNLKVNAEKGPEKIAAETLLETRNLCGGHYFSQVNFKLRRGEILSLVGLKGGGMAEVAKALFGLLPCSGEILVKGQPVRLKSPIEAMRQGIGYLPADRQREGVALIRSVEENTNIGLLKNFSNRLGFLKFPRLKRNVDSQVAALRIKTPNVRQKVLNLSGGNQQKVMIAKWLSQDMDILIFDEPTRGVDVGAKAEIHRLLIDLRNKGYGVIVLSSEMPEILVVADRIILMEAGRTTVEFSREEASEELILKSLHAGAINRQCA